MKKFEADKKGIIVRILPDVEVIFYDAYRVYIYPRRYRYGAVFHRYGAPRGYYQQNWQPFRRKLLRYKKLTLSRCYELALEHDILAMSTRERIDLGQKEVIYRD